MLELVSDSRVGVIGGGPAGSFFSYFVLQLAQRIDLPLHVDIYEPRDFSLPGARGCNMCGGIISESMVQFLATEGINLPPTVVQRGIDSYLIHSKGGVQRIDTLIEEKRIAAVYRGGGPVGAKEIKWESFDGFLLGLAKNMGANIIRSRVIDIKWEDKKPLVQIKDGPSQTYDLLVGAVGVNTSALDLFSKLGFKYQEPEGAKTFITELRFGSEKVRELFGSSMHVFLLDIPKLEFAALIPKGEHVTACMLGDDINQEMVNNFFQHPVVKTCFPQDWSLPDGSCHCFPKINTREALQPFTDRIVLIGDCGAARLYKDGIGSAYRAAKAAAVTAVFNGISAGDFQKHYWPTYQNISRDNHYGKIVFMVIELIKKTKFPIYGVLRMSRIEQLHKGQRRMSMVLWDTFTGSASYKNVFFRCLHPSFISSFLINIVISNSSRIFSRGGKND